jgi:hypothetical protein
MVDGLDYFLPSIPFLWFGYLYSIAARTGWFMDEFANACIAAYGHQEQHDSSDLIFWLKKPVHHLCHQEKNVAAQFRHYFQPVGQGVWHP